MAIPRILGFRKKSKTSNAARRFSLAPTSNTRDGILAAERINAVIERDLESTALWMPSEDGVETRVKKWQSARQSKLFGGEIPDPIFTPA
ncbi:hypothetical protein ACFKHW_39330 (plasmid) [Bradyrhizobium lupini]|uniref:hypothetical protein n=1 Tax=Rhizobium lupini TaxID=136996 RepID=UPI003670D86C